MNLRRFRCAAEREHVGLAGVNTNQALLFAQVRMKESLSLLKYISLLLHLDRCTEGLKLLGIQPDVGNAMTVQEYPALEEDLPKPQSMHAGNAGTMKAQAEIPDVTKA